MIVYLFDLGQCKSLAQAEIDCFVSHDLRAWRRQQGEFATPAYIITDTEITDEEAYWTYRTGTPAVVRQYGGRYLVREGDGETLEGDWPPKRLVVIEFENMAATKTFYESPEYRHYIGFRQRSGNSRVVLVDGYIAPKWQPPLLPCRCGGVRYSLDTSSSQPNFCGCLRGGERSSYLS